MTHTAEVVVTGIGMTTPLGGDTATSWQQLLAGTSGTRLLAEDAGPGLAGRLAAPIAVEPSEVLDAKTIRTSDRVQQFAVIAAAQAWADSGLDRDSLADERIAISIGSGIGGANSIIGSYDTLRESGERKVSPRAIPMMLANGPAAAVSLMLTARGGVHTPVSACAAGAESLAWAMTLLRSGLIDVVVAGGSEAAIIPLSLSAFSAMRAMSNRIDDPTRASRPYDRDRDGFVLGEGSGVMILERADDAVARGADIYGVIAGAGISSDAFHMVAPEPNGAGAALAIRRALAHANMDPSEVAHINAHATSTPAGDIAEAKAVRAVFGSHVDGIAVTGTKSQTGHLIGGTGAVEVAFGLLALKHGLAPSTQHVDNLDPEIGLDVVLGEPRKLPSGASAISTSFGFGGHNIAVALRPWQTRV